MLDNSFFNHLRRFIFFVCCLFALGWLVSNPGKAQPVEPITILNPGTGSLLTAPIEVTALVRPGAYGLARVTLVDRQGDLLARQVIRLNEAQLDVVELTTQLAFEIPLESAPAVLSVTTLDHAQRPIAVRTVGLTLQGAGEVKIEPTVFSDPWLKIVQPDPKTVINTSPLIVIGQVTPINGNPVIFSLLNERGGAIVTRQLAVETPGEAIDFEISLPYTPVSDVRDMRLVIRQTSSFIGLTTILDSLLITIEP
jgi:hypothetical protein